MTALLRPVGIQSLGLGRRGVSEKEIKGGEEEMKREVWKEKKKEIKIKSEEKEGQRS